MGGNVLLSAAFVSYVGAFGSEFREMLWKNVWLPDLISREIPLTEGIDPLHVLTDDATVANWQNEGLPADRISVENGAIITKADRWPLIIDPQLQGIKWIRKHEEMACAAQGTQLVVLSLGSKGWMTKVTNGLEAGNTLIIENLGENIDAVLDPVLARSIYKKGKNMFIKIGGEEVQYDSNFRLYLQTKLSNPHYKPEIAAQCTLINFIVTEKGLEDQLLAKVVGFEQPTLEKDRNDLVQKFNEYKIQLQQLEDDLLHKLANAPADILSDIPLIEGLEATKEKASEINAAVKKGKEAEIGINEAREVYRPVSSEASLIYFMLLKLCAMNHMYQYSLDSFTNFFMKALGKAEGEGVGSVRVQGLIKVVRWTIFTWVSRGLFEAHKLTFLTQLLLGLIAKGTIGEGSGYDATGMNYLLRGPKKDGDESPFDWLPDANWNAVKNLGELEGWEKLPGDIEENGARFLEWFALVCPEEEKLPMDWRELDKRPFQKLLIIKALRPDRMLPAIKTMISQVLPNGNEYVMCDSKLNSFQILQETFPDSTPTTPIYFVLSPGANVASDVDRLAKLQKMIPGETYFNISLGQGQDKIANERLETGHKMGHWVVLNNVHLMPKWLKVVEKKLDDFALAPGNARFRIFLSSDPSNSIPIGLVERCIKLTNDPPSGLKANLIGAISSLSKEEYEDLEPRTRGILFGLCYFHSLMIERKKFGGIGYNMMYPFSLGDLRDSAKCLQNYMENAPVKIPWTDLQYIFGDIMYGGHIVNDFDRLMCKRLLEFLMKDNLLDEGALNPYPDTEKDNFKAPSTSTSFNRVLEHIENEMKETPLAFGLHSNAEVGFRTKQSDALFATIMEISPRVAGDGDGDGGGGQSSQNVAESALQDILDLFRETRFSVAEIAGTLEEVGPYQNVFLQECERMNILLVEMCASLESLNLGFKGELTMTDAMEKLQAALFMDRIPATWQKLAYPSQRGLGAWLTNLNERIVQIGDWTAQPSEIPVVTWLSGLFNPQSFLTAVMQVSAQAANLELDKLTVISEVSKKMDAVDVTAPSRDGAFIHGLVMEGARWNLANGVLESSAPREMFCPMPVINIKANIVDRVDANTYMCPVYQTSQRGPTYVFSAQLRSKVTPAKWTLAGVAMLLDVV
jgi:dynein heavy chain